MPSPFTIPSRRGRHARAYDVLDEQANPAERPRHRAWCCDTHRALWPFRCPLGHPERSSAAGGVVSPVVGMPVVGGRTAA